MIQIWGKPGCPSCVAAKNLCESRQYTYEYKQLGEDFEREFILETFPGARTFPQIVVNGNKVGGYEGFTRYIEDTNFSDSGWTL